MSQTQNDGRLPAAALRLGSEVVANSDRRAPAPQRRPVLDERCMQIRVIVEEICRPPIEFSWLPLRQSRRYARVALSMQYPAALVELQADLPVQCRTLAAPCNALGSTSTHDALNLQSSKLSQNYQVATLSPRFPAGRAHSSCTPSTA